MGNIFEKKLGMFPEIDVFPHHFSVMLLIRRNEFKIQFQKKTELNLTFFKFQQKKNLFGFSDSEIIRFRFYSTCQTHILCPESKKNKFGE